MSSSEIHTANGIGKPIHGMASDIPLIIAESEQIGKTNCGFQTLFSEMSLMLPLYLVYHIHVNI